MAAVAPAIARALSAGGGAAGGGLAAGEAAGAMGALNGELGKTAQMGKEAGGAFDDLTGMLGKATGGTNLFSFALNKANEMLAQASALTNKYVAAFAPAEAELFNQALRDMTAVIGEQLVPVTRAARDIVRWFADAMATFTPIVRGFIEDGIEVMRPAFQALARAFESSLPRIMPVVKLIGEVLVAALDAVITPLTYLIEMFAKLSEAFNEFFGLEAVQMGNSRGKAFAPANTTSVQNMLTKAQTSAFGLGAESPERQTASYLKEIRDYFLEQKFINQLKEAILGGKGGGHELAKAIAIGVPRQNFGANIKAGVDAVRGALRFDGG